MRAIIFECIYSLKPNKTQLRLIGNAQFDVQIFSKRNSFSSWHRLQMALSKQRKLHTSISRSALFWPFLSFKMQNNHKTMFRQLFPYVLTNLGQWLLACCSDQPRPEHWLPVATGWGFYFGRFVCLQFLIHFWSHVHQRGSRYVHGTSQGTSNNAPPFDRLSNLVSFEYLSADGTFRDGSDPNITIR